MLFSRTGPSNSQYRVHNIKSKMNILKVKFFRYKIEDFNFWFNIVFNLRGEGYVKVVM